MLLVIGIAFGALSLILLYPVDAYAWGPITHLDFACEALEHLKMFPAAIQSVLSAYPKDFLYGTVAADITVGKKYVEYIYNCHNWGVGFLLLNEARDGHQQACAYGYLSHLAADIVAHNYFAPALMIRGYPNRALGHVYWEMRFDSRRPKRIWTLAKEICTEDFSHDDLLFQRMLKRTLFSFKTNKRIFNSILNLHRLDRWRAGIRQIDLMSKWSLPRSEITSFRNMAIEATVSFLKDPQNAPCTKVDPTGADKLLYAKENRRRLNRAVRRKKITKSDASDFVENAQKALEKAVYQDVDLPEVVDLFV